MSKPPKSPKVETQLVTTGRRKEWTHGVVNPPVYRASTCIFDSYAQLRARNADPHAKELYYGRKGTPTQWSLEEAITELHDGELTQLYPSGVAAIAGCLMAMVGSGDHLLIADAAYEPTRNMANGLFKRMGVEVEYIPQRVGQNIADYIRPNTRGILLESPGSLTFELMDIPAISAAVKSINENILIAVDNTWATPLFCNPLSLGADMVIESITKYICGHSDLLMGSVTTNSKAAKKVQRTASQLGQTVAADDAARALRGLRTLEVRLERHQQNALEIANWLMGEEMVADVLHPALPHHTDHALFKRDYKGSSGLFSIILKEGQYEDTAAMVDHMQYFKMGFSWGGYESLILPSDPTQNRTAAEWSAPGPLLRLHIGLENAQDLKDDLKTGLERYKNALI